MRRKKRKKSRRNIKRSFFSRCNPTSVGLVTVKNARMNVFLHTNILFLGGSGLYAVYFFLLFSIFYFENLY